MTELRSKLRRASEQVTLPERAFERMVERRERKRRTERVASAALALAIAVAVIGGAVAALSGLAPDRVRPGSDGTNPQVPPGVDEPRLVRCLEAAGYDWEEVYPPWNSPEHPPEDSVFAERAFWEAWEVCLVESGLEPFSEERIAAENREVRKYVRCMRDRGWSVPDPWPWEGPIHPGLLTPADHMPEDPEAADQYYRDSADCGYPMYDEEDNLLPLE